MNPNIDSHREVSNSIRNLTMINTRDLSELVEPQRLRRRFQSLAILDAILQPSSVERAFFFLAHWSIVDSVGAIRMGDDHLFAAFSPDGAFLKGYVKNCPMGVDNKNWPEMDGGVPRPFLEWMIHPYFAFERTTFCIWRQQSDDHWRKSHAKAPLGDDPDGSAYMLRFLDGNPRTFADWAQARYGAPIDIDAVGYIFDQGFVTESILRVLNPVVSYRSLAHDLRATGYPLREPL
jgi:hypothetical protein